MFRGFLNKVRCYFGVHEYETVSKLSEYTYKVRCKNCGLYFAYNSHLDLIIEWSDNVSEFYDGLDKLI